MAYHLVTQIPDGENSGNKFSGTLLIDEWFGRQPTGFARIGTAKPEPIEEGGMVSPMSTTVCVTTSWEVCPGNVCVTHYETTCTNVGGGGGHGPGPGAGDPESPMVPQPDDSGGGSSPNPNPDPPEDNNDIKNQVEDPCLHAAVDQALDANDIEGVMSEIISQLDENVNVTIDIKDQQTPIYGVNGQESGAQVDGTQTGFNTSGEFYSPISISQPYFSDAFSKEGFTAILIHEVVHSYFYYKGLGDLNNIQHEEMANNYISPMASYLQQKFNISYTDAFALSLSGLQTTDYYQQTDTNGGFFMQDTGQTLSAMQLEAIASYYRGGVNGVPNSGTQLCN